MTRDLTDGCANASLTSAISRTRSKNDNKVKRRRHLKSNIKPPMIIQNDVKTQARALVVPTGPAAITVIVIDANKNSNPSRKCLATLWKRSVWSSSTGLVVVTPSSFVVSAPFSNMSGIRLSHQRINSKNMATQLAFKS